MLRRVLTNPYVPALAIGIIVLLLPLVLPSGFYLRLATLVFINALVVLGLNLLMGYAGQISLGHAGFFAMGAYAVAIGPTHLGIPSWASLLAGVAIVGLIAFVIGRPILRFKGYHLAVVTLGLGIIVSLVLANEIEWTGGPDGMPVSRLRLGDWRVSGTSTWYWVAGGAFTIATLMVANLMSSATGRALRAVHDSEVAAGALGVNVANYKLFAFVFSAVLAALAGAFLALFDGHITPAASGVLKSVDFVAMAVLGGLGSMFGSLLGAALLVLLPQALASLHEYESIMLGGILIVLIIFLRRGIVPSLQAAILGRGR